MAECIRNPDWQEDDNLKDDLQRYVVEIFVEKKSWTSLREIIHSTLGVWGHLIEDLPISASNI